MIWRRFEHAAPVIAAAGWPLLAAERGVCFLATLRPDGPPGLHPVVVVRSRAGLFFLVRPGTPALFDLRRDPRVALHAPARAPGEDEFVVRALAQEVDHLDTRSTALANALDEVDVTHRMALFEVDVLEADWIRWRDGQQVREHWAMR